MEPTLVSVDRSKSLGRLVGEYADNQYWLGFGHGLSFGVASVFFSCFIGLWARSRRFSA